VSRAVLAIVVVAALGWITLNTARSHSPGSHGLPAGASLPAFAVPLSSSSCSGRCDANVAVRVGQGAAGARPACSVHRADVITSCGLVAHGPAVLAFVVPPVAACRGELAVLDRVSARHPEIAFAAIAVRSSGTAARSLARPHSVPIAYDHDAAVADEYGVVVCPTIVFAGRDGKVAASTVGPQSEAAIEARVAKLR
jgi:hypothetical protein